MPSGSHRAAFPQRNRLHQLPGALRNQSAATNPTRVHFSCQRRATVHHSRSLLVVDFRRGFFFGRPLAGDRLSDRCEGIPDETPSSCAVPGRTSRSHLPAPVARQNASATLPHVSIRLYALIFQASNAAPLGHQWFWCTVTAKELSQRYPLRIDVDAT